MMAEFIDDCVMAVWGFIKFILWCIAGFCFVGGMIALAVTFPLPCIVFLLLWIALKN
jgi:hypothetical protein